MQDDKEGDAKAVEDMVKAEDAGKGKGDADVKEGAAASDKDEAKMEAEPKENGAAEVVEQVEGSKGEGKKEEGNKEEGKKEEGKKEEAKKEVKEQVPEKPTLQLHGKHSLSGKLSTLIDVKCQLSFLQELYCALYSHVSEMLFVPSAATQHSKVCLTIVWPASLIPMLLQSLSSENFQGLFASTMHCALGTDETYSHSHNALRMQMCSLKF